MIKKNNKHGIIRILESFLAIILILGATTIIFAKFSNNNLESQNIISNQRAILEQLSSNAELRYIVINTDTNNGDGVSESAPQEILDYISQRLPAGYNYEVKICEMNSVCASSNYHQQVFVEEKIISSNIDSYAPKKVKMYVWKEG